MPTLELAIRFRSNLANTNAPGLKFLDDRGNSEVTLHLLAAHAGQFIELKHAEAQRRRSTGTRR